MYGDGRACLVGFCVGVFAEFLELHNRQSENGNGEYKNGAMTLSSSYDFIWIRIGHAVVPARI